MKKVSILLILLGMVLCILGGYSYKDTKEKTKVIPKEESNNSLVFIPLTDEEKTIITDYLSNKYGEDFKVLEHVSRFCIIDLESSYEVDDVCKTDNIIDDIYKIENQDGLLFYVKKVTTKEGIEVSDAISKTHSRGFYDNYILFNVIENLNVELEESFKPLEKLKSVHLLLGLGVEKPRFYKENGKYVSYVIYDDLSNVMQNFVDKNMSVDDYIMNNHLYDTSNEVSLIVKVDDVLSEKNVKDYISIIHDNGFTNLKHGLRASSILFEFNNNIYIEYDDGLDFEIVKFEDDEFNDKIRIFDKMITNDFTHVSDDVIFYDEFMELVDIVFDK